MNVIAWLRTPAATLIVLCAALASQVPHAADVFRLIVQGEGWPAVLHGYAYAVALELAVLLFVVQKRDIESYMFAAVSILVNLSYYSLHGVHLFSVAALPAWLVSIALPAAIARYSHLLVDEPHTDKQEKPVKPEKTKNRTAAPLQTPVALPVGTLPHPDANDTTADAPAESPKRGKGGKSAVSPETKAIILNAISNGATVPDVASEFSISPNTVRSWIARTAKQTNGVH